MGLGLNGPRGQELSQPLLAIQLLPAWMLSLTCSQENWGNESASVGYPTSVLRALLSSAGEDLFQ